jgi:hypothetical protein
VEGLLAGLEATLWEDTVMAEDLQQQPAGIAAADALKGRVWVTRRGMHVDRIASARLIRRFIDPEARFEFVATRGYEPDPGELRFDMFEGEYTHEGDRCTFEVLLARAGIHDPALASIGEIVHDIDLKDAKFAREEATGIARLMEGIAAANKDDERRIGVAPRSWTIFMRYSGQGAGRLQAAAIRLEMRCSPENRRSRCRLLFLHCGAPR